MISTLAQRHRVVKRAGPVGDAQIVICTVTTEQDDFECILSADERSRAARFRFAEDRHRFTVAHGRLRQVLAAHVGGDASALQFDSGPHGKPFLRGHRVEFSLSHSGDIVLIALASLPVGADVERVIEREGLKGVAAEFFTAGERMWLRAQADQIRAFYRLWTIKEAALKADGRGIPAGLRETAVDLSTLEQVSVEGRRWSIRELPVGPGYCAAVAVAIVV